MTRYDRISKRAACGASMVEFLLVSPFALLLVLGIVQLGLMFVAKQIVNEAAFVAARAGAVDHARVATMKSSLVSALIPFYQDTTERLGPSPNSTWCSLGTSVSRC
jgi:Flp pilus assembly protein TadG